MMPERFETGQIALCLFQAVSGGDELRILVFFGSEHDVPELERQKEDSGEIEEKENTEKIGGCHERLIF